MQVAFLDHITFWLKSVFYGVNKAHIRSISNSLLCLPKSIWWYQRQGFSLMWSLRTGCWPNAIQYFYQLSISVVLNLFPGGGGRGLDRLCLVPLWTGSSWWPQFSSQSRHDGALSGCMERGGGSQAPIQLNGGQGHSSTLIQLYRGKGYGLAIYCCWERGAWDSGNGGGGRVAVSMATAPLPPHFLTYRKPCGPDAMAHRP